MQLSERSFSADRARPADLLFRDGISTVIPL